MPLCKPSRRMKQLVWLSLMSCACSWGAAQPQPIQYSSYWSGTTNAVRMWLFPWEAEIFYMTTGSHLDWPRRNLMVAVDGEGNAFVAGRTTAAALPMVHPWQAELAGEEDVFLVKLDRNGRLLFSTYFGGSGRDFPEAITLDGAGNVYVSGFTQSVDLPTTPGAFQEEYNGGTAFGTGDAFIAKFSPDGRELLFCSYLGGRGDETATGLALDADGNILLAGTTDSDNFPAASVIGGRKGQDTFLLKLAASGDRLLWSRIMGGDDQEWNVKLRLGPEALVYLAGSTRSGNLPVTSQALQKEHQSPGTIHWNGFVGVFGLDGSGPFYLSYFGGARHSTILDLAVAGDGALIITGETTPSELASPGGVQRSLGGGFSDAYVARIAWPSWNLDWFTYLGGSSQDWGFGVAVDSQQRIHLVGATLSHDFPLRDGLPIAKDDSWNGFLATLSPDGKTLHYSTLLGGRREDEACQVAVGPDDLPVIAGFTQSFDFPLRQPFQSSFDHETPQHHFVMKLEPVPVRPVLEINRAGNGLILSWPVDADGFVLESSGGLRPDDWQAVSSTPLVVASQKAVITRPSATARFYRLRRP
jgi:hypothetical protein